MRTLHSLVTLLFALGISATAAATSAPVPRISPPSARTGTVVRDTLTGAELAVPQHAHFALTAGSNDSAIVATLPPGAYTAEVAGANNSTGIALVEIYELR